MPDSNYVIVKVQRAAQAFLAAQSLGDIPTANVYAGLARARRDVPCVVCSCSGAAAEEGDQFLGNWQASLIVQVRSDADTTTEDQHHDRAMVIFDLLATDEVAGSIAAPSTLSGSLMHFTAFTAVPVAQRFGVEENHWVSELELLVYCCGSDKTFN